MYLSRFLNLFGLVFIALPLLIQADVSHFFAVPPELNYYPASQQQIPAVGLQYQQYPNQHYSLSGLYGAAVVTPAPVAAPVLPQNTTTEATLPEIVDNRSAKQPKQTYHYHRPQQQHTAKFIPLSKEYLPPANAAHPAPAATALPPLDDRPNYESPLQQG